MKPLILCAEDEQSTLDKLKRETAEIVGDAYAVDGFSDAPATLEYAHGILKEGGEISIVIAGYSMPRMMGDELLVKIHRQSPMTKTILLASQAEMGAVSDAVESAGLYHCIVKPWHEQDLRMTIREALKSYRQDKDLRDRLHELEEERTKVMRERKVIDTLSRILTDKIEEIEKQKAELEEVSKELNIATVEKLLIEQEAERMSRLLSSLQNNVKNNLFIRSVLHTLVNMLQVQLSIDKRENRLLEEARTAVEGRPASAPDDAGEVVARLAKEILPRVLHQRKKTDINIHRSMTGYVKAVQRSLLGESVYYSAKPTSLLSVLGRVLQKYREILEDKKRGHFIEFKQEFHDQDVSICIFDFALINIIENLLTNSIRKLLEAKRAKMWIRLVTCEERIKTETFTVLKWMDNGTGVEGARKVSIFNGDSDKTEEGDHGIGLCDIKSTVESVGGFVRETGVFGEGALFVLGFPKTEKSEEIDFESEIDDEISPVFPAACAGKRVFIVDGDESSNAAIRDFMRKAGIPGVEEFATVEAALTRLKTGGTPPDLLLARIEPEAGEGKRFIEAVRSANSNALVLALAGSAGGEGKAGYAKLIELDKIGVYDIVSKPVVLRELFEKMKKAFARQSSA